MSPRLLPSVESCLGLGNCRGDSTPSWLGSLLSELVVRSLNGEFTSCKELSNLRFFDSAASVARVRRHTRFALAQFWHGSFRSHFICIDIQVIHAMSRCASHIIFYLFEIARVTLREGEIVEFLHDGKDE
jgi:hypothetical protein